MAKVDKWYTQDIGEDLSECLDCGYKGTDWAENDKYIFDTETGEREVFCPECHSPHYYITIQKKGGKSG